MAASRTLPSFLQYMVRKKDTASSIPPFALVLLNQRLPAALVATLWSRATFVVAADGGLDRLHQLQLRHDGTGTGTEFKCVDFARWLAFAYFPAFSFPRFAMAF